jgi:hypothetical protein
MDEYPIPPRAGAARPLLPELQAVLAAHRPAFRQERTFRRGEALVWGWLAAFGRHTLTQSLGALGLGEADWSAFYRLFSAPRLDYDRLSGCLLGEVLALAPGDRPFVAAVDGVQVPRASRTMPGTGWLKAPRTPPWRPGIHRAQRFAHLAWVPAPSPAGYSRAVPLRWEAAFPPKAVPAPAHPARTEGAAALAGLGWLRRELDAAGRSEQRVLGLGDATCGTAPVLAGLPDRVDLLARCRRDRALYRLPPPATGRGRKRLYGERAPTPQEWLNRPTGWQSAALAVRGRTVPVTYRVAGPYRVKGAAARPVFLLVVKGIDRQTPRGRRHREPSFWLATAVPDAAGRWRLPARPAELLAWAWQRWEIEVTHRDLKTGFGLGEPQSWSATGAVLSVQWAAWACGVAALAGVRAWGLGRGPTRPAGRWWGGGGRWSWGQLWQGIRQELWGATEFRRGWWGTGGDPPEIPLAAALRANATLGSRRG